MISDPYKVLGIEKGASMEEIKKAYRKKAKENHPDLHPDDPNANQKMNEINEAYDMLCNPERYQQQTTYSNPYGNTSGTYNQNGYSQNGFNQQDFRFYTFEDLFNFGFNASGYSAPAPEIMDSDSNEIAYIINCINSHDYRSAIDGLNNVASYDRDARWFYLGALASYYAGNKNQANVMIHRAVQMDPNNSLYREIENGFAMSGSAFTNATYTNMNARRNTSSMFFRNLLFFFFMMFLLQSCMPFFFIGYH